MSDGEGAHITGAIPICWRKALEEDIMTKKLKSTSGLEGCEEGTHITGAITIWMVKGKSTRWGLSRENEFPRLDVKIGEPF